MLDYLEFYQKSFIPMGENDYRVYAEKWNGKEELKAYNVWLTAVEGVLDKETKAYFCWRPVLLVASQSGWYQYDDGRVLSGKLYTSMDEALKEAREWETLLRNDQWYSKDLKVQYSTI